MFQKEGSCVDIVSTSTGQGKKSGKGKGGNNKNNKQSSEPTTSKAVDVPLRKSDRRKLRQRAAAYFLGRAHETNEDAGGKTPMERLLDDIFTKGGTISSRSLPTNSSKGHHESMVLYVKANDSSNNADDNNDGDSSSWPYRNKPQFVWMALEDKKSGRVIHESPTVALLAVVWHGIDASTVTELQEKRMIWVPSAVSSYLCRGADLMRAGILKAPPPSEEEQPQSKKKDNKKKQNENDLLEGGSDMVTICVNGNPQPFAVGRSILYGEPKDGGSQSCYGPGTKGIGVEIWNCYGDDLWRTTTTTVGSANLRNKTEVATGDSDSVPVNLEDGSYGNPGFSCNDSGNLCVWPLVGMSDEDDAEDESDENDGSAREKEEEQPQPASAEAKNENEDDKENTATVNPTAESTDTTSNEDENANTNYSDANDHEEDEEDSSTSEDESPDDLLHQAVCRALVHLGKSDLPMPVGTFYTKHVVPQKPDGVGTMPELMKETTYKKFGNYIKQWQQKDGTTGDDDSFGLLKTGPDPSNRNNKDPNALLLSYNKRHSGLHGIKKTKKPASESGNSKSTKVVVVTLYMVPNNWVKLLRLDLDAVKATHASSAARKGTGMLTLPEVRKILEGYLERESLGTSQSSSKRKGRVVLDGPLTDALYGKASNDTTPTELSRKELDARFADRMSPAFCLVEMPGSKVLKLGHGKPPVVQVEVVRRQSRKFVTRLRGLEHYYFDGIDPAVFCKEVSKRLAISGSIDTDPASNGRAALPKKGHVEFIFGANIVDELEALLTGDESISDHGGVKGGDWPYPRIPSNVIEVILRKGVPARKKRRPGGSGKS